MNVAIFSDTARPQINGVANSVDTLSKALRERGHQVYVISPVESEFVDIVLPSIKLTNFYDYNLSTFYDAKSLSLLKEKAIDIVHIHTEFGAGLFGRYFASQNNLPVVYTYHTLYQDYGNYLKNFHLDFLSEFYLPSINFLVKKFIENVTMIVVPSLKTKKVLSEITDNQRIKLLPTAIKLDKFKVVDNLKLLKLRQDLHLSDDRTFVYIGRIAKEKNLEMVIEAFNQIKEDYNFLIVGVGPMLEELKASNTNPKIKFIGGVDNSQIAYYYHLADAFISASTSETQGLTFIEAIAANKFLFLKDVELIEQLFTNLNYQAFNSVADLKIKLIEYLNNSNYLELVKDYQNHLVDYDFNIYGEKMEKIYLESINDYLIEKVVYQDNQVKIVINQKEYLIELDDYDQNKSQLFEGNKINFDLFTQINKADCFNKVYQKYLKLIAKKFYTVSSLTKELQKEYSDYLPILNKLLKTNYLDDNYYLEVLITNYQNQLLSKKALYQKLLQKGFETEQIENHQLYIDYPQDEIFKLKLDKLTKRYQDLAYNKAKSKIIEQLYLNGFSYQDFDLEYDATKEREKLEQAFDKYYYLYLNKESLIKKLKNLGFDYFQILELWEERNDQS